MTKRQAFSAILHLIFEHGTRMINSPTIYDLWECLHNIRDEVKFENLTATKAYMNLTDKELGDYLIIKALRAWRAYSKYKTREEYREITIRTRSYKNFKLRTIWELNNMLSNPRFRKNILAKAAKQSWQELHYNAYA